MGILIFSTILSEILFILRHALQRVSQELDWNRIDICRVTKGAYIEQL
jgi:hypothetical protein